MQKEVLIGEVQVDDSKKEMINPISVADDEYVVVMDTQGDYWIYFGGVGVSAHDALKIEEEIIQNNPSLAMVNFKGEVADSNGIVDIKDGKIILRAKNELIKKAAEAANDDTYSSITSPYEEDDNYEELLLGPTPEPEPERKIETAAPREEQEVQPTSWLPTTGESSLSHDLVLLSGAYLISAGMKLQRLKKITTAIFSPTEEKSQETQIKF